MQVMALTPDQINSLPPVQRQQIMMLVRYLSFIFQITHSCQRAQLGGK